VDRAASLLALQREPSAPERLEGLLAQRPAMAREVSAGSLPERLVVRDGERLLFVETEQIDWIESAGNYVRIHNAGRAYLMRTTMNRIARRLAGRGMFVRIRRSALINVRAVATMERYGKGTYVVHLRSGAKVISSRYYQPELRKVLRQYG
jgi:two-component system, LytTR family, response regulator